MAQDEVIDNWWETEQDLLEDVADELSSSSTDESLPVNAAEKKPVGPKKHPKDASIAREKSSNDNSSQSDDENGDNATVSVEKTEEVKKAPAKPRKRTPPLDAWRLVGHAKGFKLLRRLAASLHESFATEHSPASNAVQKLERLLSTVDMWSHLTYPMFHPHYVQERVEKLCSTTPLLRTYRGRVTAAAAAGNLNVFDEEEIYASQLPMGAHSDASSSEEAESGSAPHAAAKDASLSTHTSSTAVSAEIMRKIEQNRREAQKKLHARLLAALE